jgi:hypothetical protein
MLKKYFHGVYPADATPNIKHILRKQDNISIIFNLSNHDEPGSHYVAVLITRTKIFYFDSYGKKLTNKHIKKFLIKFNQPIYYHVIPIQHKNSIFCGLYSLAYLYSTQILKMNFTKFFDIFKYPATMTNDNIVTTFLIETNKKMINYYIFYLHKCVYKS